MIEVGHFYEIYRNGTYWYETFLERLGDLYYFGGDLVKNYIIFHRSELKEIKEICIDGKLESRYPIC